jgi:putative hydrolase of the HAD superfamily
MAQLPSQVVLFDLFDTLVPGGSRAERDAVSGQIAGDLAVDAEGFTVLMLKTFDERMRGKLGGVRDTLATLARQLGSEPDEHALDVAVERRLTLTRSLHQQTWALPALEALRAAGFLIGVVSDCSAETPEIWAESPIAPHIDATSFSCETGLRKPNPEAYMTAVRALGAQASTCVFVGDGGSHELTGATALGMWTFKYAPLRGQTGDTADREQGWKGPTLTDLMELPAALRA